jgi:hypothetical protein
MRDAGRAICGSIVGLYVARSWSLLKVHVTQPRWCSLATVIPAMVIAGTAIPGVSEDQRLGIIGQLRILVMCNGGPQ